MNRAGFAFVVAALLVVGAGCSHQDQNSQSTATATTAAEPSESPSALDTSGATPAPDASASPEASTSPEASGSPEASASPEASPSSSASPADAAPAASPAPSCSPGTGTITASYFTLPEKHPDVHHDIDGVIVTGLVKPALGPDGYPVVTNIARTGKNAQGKLASGPITDVNAAGEIMWWSTGDRHGGRLEKTLAECLPIDHSNMFADGYNDDQTYFLTGHYQGFFSVPDSRPIKMDEGSDDDSWIFIDGKLVFDNGGVKSERDAPTQVAHLSPGAHSLDVFYADRHGGGASLHFEPSFAVDAAPANLAVPTAPASIAPTAKPVAAAIAKQLTAGHRIRIYGIHFDVDKATIQPQSEKVVGEIAKLLKDNASWHVRIEGHTDSDGGYEHNMLLSQNRAQAVVNDLVSRYRIARGRLSAEGFGYSRPVKPNTTAANKALNRRVELVLL